jgi:hypothetical protein
MNFITRKADTVHPAFIEVLQAGSDGTNAPLFLSGTLFTPSLTFPTGSVTLV